MIYLKTFVLGSDFMRKLESVEKDNYIKRSWYIQGYDLDTIQELELPAPLVIKNMIDMGCYTNSSKFIRILCIQ